LLSSGGDLDSLDCNIDLRPASRQKFGILLPDLSAPFHLTPHLNGQIAAVQAIGLMLAPVAAADGEQMILQAAPSITAKLGYGP
jgi:hypothetical protein